MDESRSKPGLASPVSGERMLQDLLGTRERAQQFYDRQVLDHLSEPMRRFIAQQHVMFLATSDARGACDNTLRAGSPGFVVVLDEHRLAWPEYRGNGVMASRGNIAENPNVGLLFVDFVRDVIGLHVNGSAHLVQYEDLRRELPELPDESVPGRRPEHWVVTHVEEAYIHCAKYIPRFYAEPSGELDPIKRPSAKKSDYFAVRPGAATDKGGDHSPPGRGELCRSLPSSPAPAARRSTPVRWHQRLLRILRQLRHGR